MKIVFNTILLCCIIAFAGSCKKKESCSNADICVTNVGTDVVYYCWGCNFYTDSLLPGETTCYPIGEWEEPNSNIVTFDSDHGTYAIEQDECHEKRDI